MNNEAHSAPSYKEGEAPSTALTVLGERRYDTSFADSGLAAKSYTRSRIFAEYQRGRAANTQSRQRDDLQRFSTYLALVPISRSADELYTDAEAWRGMNDAHLVAFREWMLLEGDAQGSIRVRMATVQRYCELATRAGVIAHEELALIKMVKAPSYREGINIDRDRQGKGIKTRRGHKKATPANVSTRQALNLKAATLPPGKLEPRPYDEHIEERDALMMCLFIEHGMRVSEVVGLDTMSISLEEGSIVVNRSKTYQKDTYDLLPRTREAAEAYLPLVAGQGPLFLGYGQQRITRQGIAKRVKQLGQEVGIPDLSPHDLRHWWTRDALRQGNSLDMIQKYGGWNSAAMPLHYSKQFGVPHRGLKISQ